MDVWTRPNIVLGSQELLHRAESAEVVFADVRIGEFFLHPTLPTTLMGVKPKSPVPTQLFQ